MHIQTTAIIAPSSEVSAASHLPLLVATEPPPDHYYAENLLLLIESVQRQYGDLLDACERGFGDRVVALSTGAQRLLARLVGRKGPVVRVDSLAYPEVERPERALAELAAAGLVLECPEVSPDLLLARCRRAELERWFPLGVPVRRKDVRIAAVLAAYPEPVVHARVAHHCAWVAVADTGHLDLYRLLFFGDRRSDLAAFVVRDLGIVRYEEYEVCRERRLFADRDALDAYLALARIGDYAEELGPAPPPERAALVVEALWHPAADRLLERRRSRILNSLGRRLERARAWDAALTSYARSTAPPARERRTRILARLGDSDAVHRMRDTMRERPRSALERDFAERFGRVRRCWDCPVDVLAWDAAYSDRVEAAAAAALTADGGTAWHLENALPLGLFGLAYWDWAFAPVEGMFVNAFQTAPMDLFWPDFFAARRALCADPLALDDAALRDAMLDTARSRRDVANRLVDWRVLSPETARRLLDAIPMADTRKLLAIVVEDLERARTGFPDLTVVYPDGSYEFVEVKGPNDQLRPHQRLWIDKLRAAGLPARLVRFR